METKYPKLSDFFALINEAHADLQKLLPPVCDNCGLPDDECKCDEFSPEKIF
jgi:hypothetical protein